MLAMKFDTREIVAVLIVFLLPLGLGQFVAKATLPESPQPRHTPEAWSLPQTAPSPKAGEKQ